MYQISQQTLGKLLNYLQTKPYIEVAQLIQEIRNSQPLEEKQDE